MCQKLLPANATTSLGVAPALFIMAAPHLKRGTDLLDEVTFAAQTRT
jgi:hypothetical protein